MACPICDQKPMNCDCTAEERRQYGEIEDLEDEIARLRLTDEELKAVRKAAFAYAQNDDDSECAEIASALLGLAERMK